MYFSCRKVLVSVSVIAVGSIASSIALYTEAKLQRRVNQHQRDSLSEKVDQWAQAQSCVDTLLVRHPEDREFLNGLGLLTYPAGQPQQSTDSSRFGIV